MATKKNKIEEIPSSELKRELDNLSKKEDELKHRVQEVQRRLKQHLTNKEPDEFTKSLYINGVNFNPKSITVHSEKLIELTKKISELKEKYVASLRRELVRDFLSENHDLKSDMKKVDLTKNETGNHLFIKIN